jgi:O-acetyl-ADP-ribose deacetylase (regulator of RNase III)
MPRTERKEFEGFTITLIQGDITKQEVDAIANAANSALAGGGGVDGAIHRAGGSEIKEETSKIGGCPTGGAVATTAGRLNAEYVFHAVGPVYRGGEENEAELLASAYKSCLDLAGEHELESIAFPSISTGVYGYPLEEASRIAINTVIDFCQNSELPTDIRFVLFDEETFDAYAAALKKAAE